MIRATIMERDGRKRITITKRANGSCFVQVKDEGNYAYLEEDEVESILKEMRRMKE